MFYRASNGGTSLTQVGTFSGNTTIDVSSLSGYDGLTINDFIVEVTSVSGGSGRGSGSQAQPVFNNSALSITKSYNPSTGILTLSGCSGTVGLYNDGGATLQSSYSYGASGKVWYLG